MAKTSRPDFQAYLESISNKYERWWNLYTLTDTVDKQREQTQFSPFDFRLMMPAVRPNHLEGMPFSEKIERLSVLEGIRKYAVDHVLLVGRPGLGKSTALARLLLEEAQKAKSLQNPIPARWDGLGVRYIPILVELRYWQSSIIDRIQSFLLQHDPSLDLDEATLKSLLRQRYFLLLFDGLNELPSDEARRQVVVFRRDYPQTPMIFTTRDLGVGGDLGIQNKLEMQPLTEAQMHKFVQAYLPQQGEEMLRRLRVDVKRFAVRHRLLEFGQTPLLLWMLCNLFKQTGEIPPNLGLVFRVFTQTYERNLKEDAPVADESRRWWSKLLQYLAFVMMLGELPTELRVTIPRQEAEDILTQFLANEKFDKPRDYAKRCLEDLLKHHLIQVESNDKIEFRHQLLQEYYAAEYLLQQLPNLSDAKLKRDYLNYLKWTEPLVLMLALLEQEEQAMRVVKLALEVDLILGSRLAGEVKLEFQEQTVQMILDLHLSNVVAIKLLSCSRSQLLLSIWIELLGCLEDFRCRLDAVNALEIFSTEAAIPVLIRVLEEDKSWQIRSSAVKVLGKLGNEAVIPRLMRVLKEDESVLVRTSAAEALGKLGNEAVIPELLHALENEDYFVSNAAAKALEKINSKVAIPGLLGALKNGKYFVSLEAAKILEKIGDEVTISECLRLFYNEDEDEDSNLRYNIFHVVGELTIKERGVEACIPELISGLQNKDFVIRRYAAHKLGELGETSAIPGLLETLNDQEPSVRSSAALALKEIGNESAIPGLCIALEDDDIDVLKQVIDALDKILTHSVHIKNLCGFQDEIINITLNQDHSLRKKGCEFFKKFIGKEDINFFRRLLKNENHEIRFNSAYILGQLGKNEGTVELLRFLKYQDHNARSSAAYILGELGNNVAIPELIEALNDQDLNVCFLSAQALGKLGSEVVVSLFLKVLEYGVFEVQEHQAECDYGCRRMSAELLGRIGSKTAIPGLVKVLEHSPREKLIIKAQEGLRSGIYTTESDAYCAELWPMVSFLQAAATALGEIGDEAAVPGLLRLLKEHQDVNVFTSIYEALVKINSPKMLPGLWQIQIADQIPNGTVFPLIEDIQERCKFYNYEIAQFPFIEEEIKTSLLPDKRTVHIQAQTLVIQDHQNPQFNFNTSVGNVNIGDINIQGDQVGFQQNEQT